MPPIYSLMNELAKLLIILGGVMVLAGVVLLLLPKIPWLGRLPGDVFFERGRFTFYFPLATCIIVSIVLTLLVSLFRR